MKFRFLILSFIVLSGCSLVQTPDTTNTETETSDSNKVETVEETTANNDVATTVTTPEVTEPAKPIPQLEEDVWQRIAMQLYFDIPENKRVKYYRNWYLKRPTHMETVSARAQPFLYMITEKIEQRGMPLELALLPVVESAYDQFAYSHGRAAGLWQFVPETGKRFGLAQNWWYDGRRDIEASTDAALDLLAYLNRKFDGDWLLALAAYNTGEGRVFRAMRNNRKAGKPTDFWALDLPKETRGYVPKLIALADLVKNKEHYGLSLPAIDNKPVLTKIEPQMQMDLALAANYAGLTLSKLQQLNPGYNHWATAPEGPNHLLLPLEKVDRFNSELAKNKNRGVQVVRYKVKSGDSLGLIAQRNNTTVKIIQRANQLSGTRIRAGQHLLIPKSIQDEAHYTFSAPQRLAKITSQSHGNYKLKHTVKSGESLWIIGRQYKVSHKTLARWNGMSPKDTLRPGQKLVIWKEAKSGERIKTITYQIRRGDSLSSIAAKYKVSVTQLRKWNSLRKGSYLQPGQKLKLHININNVSA
ncbi:LysM peptidoglycan-binding domain-containing protein [Veronia pacifica]|uniref:Lytic transglycosylase n=1 Tax=Veronia pacifica TaxID=1080227 RepID=A0A1C3EEJ7_9GAMM|nr:LysM peptidoglycan-binding domain-containing protein [Veronia pacifica]ODA31661.1 lytic transglycosylase [Veronia pacifica]